VAQALAVYQPEAPRTFSLDTGRVAADQTVVVEVNDGHSLGVYGLMPLAYARFLSARWAQMTGARTTAIFEDAECAGAGLAIERFQARWLPMGGARFASCRWPN